jgi:hypothetical protein
MRAIVGVVLIGVLVGAAVQEMSHSHGELSSAPKIAQQSAPPARHPYDQTMDVRDVREPVVRDATPTSANTVPAPVGADSTYADISFALVVSLVLLLVPFSVVFFAQHRTRQDGGFRT